MTVAVFSYAAWAARYPTLAVGVDEALAAELFTEATIYLDNTDASVVPADAVTYQPRLSLLGMVLAHLVALEAPSREGVVGRISSASQGSVSVSADMGPPSGSAAWWQQTTYGANFWQATAAYRTFAYRPPAASAQRF